MLINSFKSLKPSSLGLLLAIGVGLWLIALFGVQPQSLVRPAPLYSLVLYWFGNHYYLTLLISLALVITEAIMLNTMIIEHQLLSHRTYIPALLYVLLMSCIPETLNLHPFLFCNFFLIKTLNRLFSTYKQDLVSATYYDAGLFLGIAVLFYYPLIFLFPIVFICLILFRSFKWNEWAIAILGHITPYLFLFTYAYYTGNLNNILADIPSFSFLFSDFSISVRPSFIVLGITLIVFAGYSFKSVLYEIKSTKIKVRKMFAALFWVAMLTLLMVVSFSSFAIYIMTILSIPMAIYFSAYFVNATGSILKEIIFILILAVIVYVQIVNL